MFSPNSPLSNQHEPVPAMHTQPYALAGLVHYGPDHADTRIVFNNGRSKVIALALQGGNDLNEHKTPSDTFFFVLDGELIFTMSGSQFKLKKGDAIDIPANIPHSLRAIVDSTFLLVH